MSASRRVSVAVFLLLVLAAWLRFQGLEKRPLHADEATGAKILAQRMESGTYRFDPSHFHGPMLSTLALPVCRSAGISSWQTMKVLPLRITVAACGLLAVAGTLLLVRERNASWAAAAFVATSPLLVYYSRMFIHEPVFVLFSIPALAGLLALLEQSNHPWRAAISLGVGTGAMAATRETVVISLFCWTIAALPWVLKHHGLKPFLQKYWLQLAGAIGAGLLVVVVCYTPFGTASFFRTFADYQTGAGHDKPLGFYLYMLAAPKQAIGHWWCEGGILILALCTFLKNGRMRGRFLASAGLLHLLVISLIAYKTPWLACLGWFQLCIAAGYGTAQLLQISGTRRKWIPIAAIASLLLFQFQQTRAALRFEWDSRNPYAYVPTVKMIEQLPRFLQNLQEAADNNPPVIVIGSQYWPLPWYLRSVGEVGYLPELPVDAPQRPILLLMPTLSESDVKKLEATHTLIPHGLRANAPMLIAVRNDLWNTYLQQTP
ncbi:MAG: glycosyltransferase family 39 protein [Pontiellaceae bacterium]|nr:glycosyltransferase family 39 protein [Pontiellaceae bacterium]MBN2783705.1 glycosyltransferase family 39 protein [Pontiellaceae bacterium]